MTHKVHFFPLLVAPISLVLALVLSSCAPPTVTPTPAFWHNIDPTFREFVDQLGGIDMLGEAISSIRQEGSLKVQYLVNAKLVFEMDATPDQRFRLAPLGVDLGFEEPSLEKFSQDNPYACKGHTVAPIFIPSYEKLGKRNTGCPITELKYNPNRKRYEQYFENLGLYAVQGRDKVGLLAYGLIACTGGCRDIALHHQPDENLIDVYHTVHPLFQSLQNTLGSDFTGFGLTEAYTGKDGRLEQIFENLVLVANSPIDPNSIGIRAINQLMAYPAEQPATISDPSEGFFFPVQGELGYMIPAPLWDYILQHGGINVSGAPITHARHESGESIVQCFENLCLRYFGDKAASRPVQPEPLGYAYFTLFYRTNLILTQKTPTPGKMISLRDWLSQPFLNPGGQQEIGVSVQQDNQPLAGANLILQVTFPDGTQQNFNMPATGPDGNSNYRLPPIDAPIGSLITYDVCLAMPDSSMFCTGDSFPVWEEP